MDNLSEKFEINLSSLRNNRTNLIWELKKIGILDYFEQIHTASAFGNADDKSALLTEAGAKTERDLIVGDNDIDILSGKRLNLFTCGVLGGMCTEKIMYETQPNFTISEIHELLPIVNESKWKNLLDLCIK